MSKGRRRLPRAPLVWRGGSGGGVGSWGEAEIDPKSGGVRERMALVECVPNISEGRDRAVIDAVAAEIERTEGCTLLDVDPGQATNRTVITFVGDPDSVVEGAFRVIAKAAELIDMSGHQGEHPRMGATDITPRGPTAFPKLTIDPQPGLLVIFPCWLYHYVNPFRGKGERISIAFNIRLKIEG